MATSSNLFHNVTLTVRYGQHVLSRITKAGPVTGLFALVRVIEGTVLDVAVDIRKGSPTFGKHVSVELSGENHRQFFIPRGFAHGFSVLSETALFQYKCDNFYSPLSEGALAWDDPDLGIDWRIPPDKILLSEKDRNHSRLKDAGWLFDYETDYYE